ncbi:MAG: hypothetical protein SFX74_05950 [Fimbriimonadaceae bacterium]|nr:hypothetical protein [Fimbriimonadaceae bacterium]
MSTELLHDPIYKYPQYTLKRQIMKMIGGRYRIFGPGGELVLVAEKEGFKLKEQIHVYRLENRADPVFGIFARQVLDFAATYDVVDLVTNQKLGALQRKGWKSIARDEWQILDPWDRPVGLVVEDSMAMALIRRFISNLIPQNYDGTINGVKVADYRQSWNPLVYNLTIDFLPDMQGLDRRVGFAAAILLASIEGRQSG